MTDNVPQPSALSHPWENPPPGAQPSEDACSKGTLWRGKMERGAMWTPSLRTPFTPAWEMQKDAWTPNLVVAPRGPGFFRGDWRAVMGAEAGGW